VFIRENFMKYVKRKTNKIHLAIALLISFAVLLALAVVLGLTLFKDDIQPESEKPEILEGEDIYYNMAIAYPVVEEKNITMIGVKNKNGAYDLVRPDEGGTMLLCYTDKNGDTKVYYPSILAEENKDYNSLYAIEMNDSYKQFFKLSYLSIALEIPYFEARIILSEDKIERANELREYGLTEDKKTTVTVYYTDEDGKDQAHVITIGAKNINGNGYYFMVDDRDYVYTSQNNYFDYALMGFESFIKATLVSEGLTMDNGQEPFLTTNFYEWVNEVHDTEGEKVTADSTVVMYLDTLEPKNKPKNGSQDETSYGDGYRHSGYTEVEFDLKKYNTPELSRLRDIIVGKELGTYYDLFSPNSSPLDALTVTLTSRSNQLDFSKNETQSYSYEIYKIESILTENGEICNTGTPIGENHLIKAAYNLYVDDKLAGSGYYGVFDLSETVYNPVTVGILKQNKIGEIEPINLRVEYSKENSVKIDVRYVVAEIISIENKNGKRQERVTAESRVSYKYRIMKNGVLGEELKTDVINFNENTEQNAYVLEVLKGETAGRGKNIEIRSYTAYCQYVYNFKSYKIARIDRFITGKLVSAFRFQNGSKRDPYYGESLYENLMEDENRLYGLNSAACEEVVKILGGISNESNANTADGFFGDETVAIGLTPEVKLKYGLYAYTVYFELPRQIYITDSDYSETLDDYDSAYRLGFTLFISEEQIDGTRYVGSDMYDLVTKIDSKKLDFLNYDFVSYWARRDIIMMDIANIENIGVEFNMEDIYGAYDFSLTHERVNLSSGKEYNKITVYTTVLGENSGNLFTSYVKDKNYSDNAASLTEFYKYALGDKITETDKESAPDSTGTGEFKRLVRMIYMTGYTNLLTKEEQAEILRNGKLLMKLSLKVVENKYNQGNRYVYEFYRNDDRRVMVRLYQADEEGNIKTTPVSDFYVSTFAFKKLVSNFGALLNGKILDTDQGYSD
jgi:hypothetical protein